jgi:hypothetical protein
MLRKIIACVIVKTFNGAAVDVGTHPASPAGVIQENAEFLLNDRLMQVWTFGCIPRGFGGAIGIQLQNTLTSEQVKSAATAMKQMDINFEQYNKDGNNDGIKCLYKSGGIHFSIPVNEYFGYGTRTFVGPYKIRDQAWNLSICYILYKKVLEVTKVDLDETRAYEYGSSGSFPTIVSRIGCNTLTIENKYCKLSVLLSIDSETAKSPQVHLVNPCVTPEELATHKLTFKTSITPKYERVDHFRRSLECTSGSVVVKYTWNKRELSIPQGMIAKPRCGVFNDYSKLCSILFLKNAQIEFIMSRV